MLKNVHEMAEHELVHEIVLMAHNGDQGAQELIDMVKNEAKRQKMLENTRKDEA